MRIKGCAGWVGSGFLFLNKKFLVLATGPSCGAARLGMGFRCWAWWSVWWGSRGRGLPDGSVLVIDLLGMDLLERDSEQV